MKKNFLILALLCVGTLAMLAQGQPFKITTISQGAFAEGTEWYFVKLGGQYMYTSGSNVKFSSSVPADANLDTYQWAFVGDAKKFHIYNKKEGTQGSVGFPGTTFPANGYSDAQMTAKGNNLYYKYGKGVYAKDFLIVQYLTNNRGALNFIAVNPDSNSGFEVESTAEKLAKLEEEARAKAEEEAKDRAAKEAYEKQLAEKQQAAAAAQKAAQEAEQKAAAERSKHKPNRASLMKRTLGAQAAPVYLDREFAVRHPVNIMTDGGANRTELQSGSYVDVIVKKCPEYGQLIIFDVHYIDAEGAHDLTFSWSGADTHLMFSGIIYQPVRGNLRYPKDSGSALCYVEGKWVLILRACNWMIGAGLAEGMTTHEVINAFGKDTPGRLTNAKKVGAFTKYSFESYAMEKQYHLNGDYHYNATTRSYLDLYFDANGRLNRWITNF